MYYWIDTKLKVAYSGSDLQFEGLLRMIQIAIEVMQEMGF